MNDFQELVSASTETHHRRRRGRRRRRADASSGSDGISSSVWVAFTLAVALAFVVGWFGGREFLYYQVHRDVDKALAMVDEQMAEATDEMLRMFDPSTPEGRRYQQEAERIAREWNRWADQLARDLADD